MTAPGDEALIFGRVSFAGVLVLRKSTTGYTAHTAWIGCRAAAAAALLPNSVDMASARLPPA